ncbi:MAG: hypothetical protein PHY30_02520 [Candidatus Pacebacteria bacterium]|nr:hypothetical protein [Candidatus Paceibacterota bacterium]
MDFEDIKKIVDREGKVVIIEGKEAYVVSKYTFRKEEAKALPEEKQEEKKEGLKLEDLPF